MANGTRKPGTIPAASRRVAELLAQIQDLTEQLEIDRQLKEEHLELLRELEVSREQYANLYDRSPAGHLTLDRLGVILDINLAGASMLGKDRAAILRWPLRAFVAKFSQRTILNHIGKLRRGESGIACELTIACKDAAPRTVELRTVRMERGAGKYCSLFYASLVDITERKAAENALRVSEEKYRNLFNNMSEEVYFWQIIRDEVGQIKTWRLLDINPAGLKGWGKTQSESIGKTAEDIFPGTMVRLMPIVQKVLAEGVPHSYETIFPFGRNMRFTIIPLGEYFITVGVDISDIKKAEAILQESNASLEKMVEEQTAEIHRGYDTIRAERQRLLDVMETLPVMICLLTPDYQIAFANRSFRDKFGETNHQRCHEHCFSLTKPCSFCESYNVLKTGRPHHWEVTMPNGNVIDVFDFPFIDTDGSKMILEMQTDISDLRRGEKKLQDAQRDLETRAAQLRALATELTLTEQRERNRLALVLHDGLQQTLVAAKYQIALLDRCKNVTKAAKEVSNLIDDCIETSRSLTAELSPPILHQGGLVPALEWLIQWMHNKHGLSMELESQGHEKPAEDIAILLFHSIRELLFNIIKHSGTREARIGVKLLDGYIRVEVTDRGAGFDPEQGFSRPHEGSGMGLFSIRERLRYLGGTMEVDSAPGRGTRVTLTARSSKLEELPEYIPKPRTTVSFITKPESKTSDGAKIPIVIVDDHRVMRQGLAYMLSSEPDISIVGEASDGKAAIDLILNTRPAVVLMDITMPGMDGIEATRQIHAQMPEVKIIGLSMFQEGEQAASIIAAGASKYLSKTGPSEDLIKAIRGCVTR
jgi:PAS domain S-box-containing protein